MTTLLPLLSIVALLAAAGPAEADCTTKRCRADQAAAVAALRAEVAAGCDCAGSTRRRDYKRCAKALVRAARHDGRISKACGLAVQQCETRSTCGREDAVVCCVAKKKGDAVGRVKRSAPRCGDATVCTQVPYAADACLPDARCCLAFVERGPPDVIVPGSTLALVDGLEVRANGPEGCADLDGPLIALNYFSFADHDAYLRYASQVVGVLASFGHRPLGGGRRIETLLAPSGAPANGGAYEHDEFALARYTSAGGFLDFIRSEGQQSIIHDQQAGARQSDYVWGLQRCIVGCEDSAPALDGMLVAHIFRYEGADLDASIEALAAAPGAPEVWYAGENVAELRVHIGTISLNPQKPPWGRGAVVFRVPSREAAVEWLGAPAYLGFRAETAEDVVVLLESGF